MDNKGYRHIPYALFDAITFLAQALPKRSIPTWLELLFGAMLTQAGFVTEAYLAITPRRHWTTYYKWIQSGRWSWISLGLQTARLALRQVSDKRCFVVLDDTIVFRTSIKAPESRIHHQHGQKANRPDFVRGQNWVSLSLSISKNGRSLSVPILSRLPRTTGNGGKLTAAKTLLRACQHLFTQNIATLLVDRSYSHFWCMQKRESGVSIEIEVLSQSNYQKGIHRMSKDRIIELKRPEEKSLDALTEILREGAQKLLATAIEAELNDLLTRYKEIRTETGQQAVVRNGYLPKREIQTGLGDISVRLPKVRDRSGNGIKFNSMLVPPYLKRTKAVEEFLPWLYLKGISTGDFQETLQSLLGPDSPGLSANTISRLKQVWEKEYHDWRRRDLSSKRYVYVWADGIYSNVRMDDRLCILVIIGSDENGRKELIALSDGYRESEAAWSEILTDLRERG